MTTEYVSSKDAEERKLILTIGMLAGCRWHNQPDWTPETIERDFPFYRYPVVRVDFNNKHMTGFKGFAEEIPFSEWLNKLVLSWEPVTKIRLNNEYTAEVGKATTRVGCTIFDNKVILEVAEAINKQQT